MVGTWDATSSCLSLSGAINPRAANMECDSAPVSGTLRVAGEMLPITAGDVIFIPPGPEYPHQILNTSDAPLKYLSLSVNADLEICEYPDSGKYLAMAAGARGRTDTLLQDGRMHRVATDLDYWDGEP